MPYRNICILTLAFGLSACGAATTPAQTESAATDRDELGEAELAKLGDILRDRVSLNDTEIFPVRVKFATRPSRNDLSELFLVAVDRDAVGRVDLATLKVIASREDVTHIVYVDAGYAEDDDEFLD